MNSRLIAYLLMSKCFYGFAANFFKKILAYYKYFFRMVIFLAIDKATWASWAKYINILIFKLDM